MKVKKIHIDNILSYDNETIELNKDLNIIVGANGSGKSNLISAFRFVNYILMYGIDDAVSLLGGFDNLINLNALKDDTINKKL